VGELVVVRATGSFRRRDLQRLQLLQDLACLALRKTLLLEEAQRRRQEAEEASAVRARLIRGLTHDLKNPLGAAEGYAELLQKGTAGTLEDPQQGWVSRIRRANSAMAEVIQDLVEFSLGKGTELPLHEQPVDLAHVVRESTEDYMAMASAVGLDIECDVEASLPVVTDERRIREILGNLLSNAVKYSPQGSSVSVRARRASVDGQSVILVEVEDTGVGIADEKQERIFQEFARLHPEQAPGTGIGLAMSRKVARALGGDLTVRSVAGSGSTFTLFLPSGTPSQPRAMRLEGRETAPLSSDPAPQFIDQ
jgi:signal transduction histidine kinase